MPTTSEYNQFRRLVGDYGANTLTTNEINSWLNDAVFELTADFQTSAGASAPISEFDTLVQEYHPEVIYKAAINYWWSKAAELSGHLSTTVGTASQQSSDKWTRAMQMIQTLEAKYQEIQSLGIDITIGNLSYFSKQSLTRRGGQSEESYDGV